MYKVVVDSREPDSFISKLSDKFPDICSTRSLDIGDIHITYNDHTVVVIERKEINDLASSLQDGRYHEQKARLKQLNSRVIYLIEGGYDKLTKKYHTTFSEDAYQGIILNTIIRDGISVFNTVDIDDTIELIGNILKRIPKYVKDMIIIKDHCEGGGDYAAAIDIKKRDNVTPVVCYINQLRQIPGISVSIAQAIVDKYATMRQLIDTYDEDYVKDIMVGKRKIGPIVASRLGKYLGL